MEFLIPSEVARLVYGYLEEEGCPSAAKLFLETSPHLVECKKNVAKGRNFNTKILHLGGLIEILDLLAEVTCYVRSIIEQEACKKDLTLVEVLNQLKLTLKLGSNDDTVNKPVYLRITMPSESKKKKKSDPPEVNPSQPNVAQNTSQISIEDPPESPVNQSHALQLLLENKALHEKLAENINKVVANKSEADSLERILEKKIVETIVNTTEKDPIFQEMLEELVGPVEATNSTPEDTEIENEDVASRLQGVQDPQQGRADSRTIVDKASENVVIAPNVSVQSYQMPFTTPPLTTQVPHPMQPLVNASPYQTGVPQGLGFGSVTMPAIPSALSPQDPASYVFNTPMGKVTVCSAISPLATGASPRPSTAAAPVVPPTPLARQRNIQPRVPMQSTIRVLHPSIHQSLAGNSTINVLPNQGSLLQGLLQGSSISPSETVKVPGTPGPRLQPTSVTSSPGIVGPLVRIGGVRTRGGKAKVVKTYNSAKKSKLPPKTSDPSTPVPITPSESRIEEVTVPQPSNTAIPEPQQKNEPGLEPNVDNAKKEDIKLTSNESTESCTSDPRIEASCNTQNTTETCAPERPDATPQQGSEPKVKLRKRLSLSTPRKGSHVRTLEFKTPPKGTSLPRKSASSPKHRGPERVPQMHQMLQNVKKSELFKSPPKKEAKSWDADLRSAVSNPCEDIPTSVGLKRKEPVSPKNRRKNVPSKVEIQPKTESSLKIPELNEKSDTTQDLVTQIQRDVLDVIDEEDINDINSNNKSTDSIDSPKTKSPVKSPGTGSILEIGDIGVPPSTIKKLYPKRLHPGDENSSTLDSPISKAPKENLFITPPRAQTSGSESITPSKNVISPEKSLPNTPSSVSLEATLIRECSRIECEGLERARTAPIFGSHKDLVFDEKSGVDDPNHANCHEETSTSGSPLLPPPKGILVLKTPAKSTLPIPVEMTPLSKIINEETRLSNCTLLTPTIPPTPDYEELKTQNPNETEDKGSPHAITTHVGASPPTQESPKPVSRKSPKNASKTPIVRLRAKNPKPSTSKSKAPGKKKVKPKEIDCNQLIAQCLQDVKSEVYGSSVPNSEDDKSKSTKIQEKKSPPIPKKKTSDKKKPKSYKNVANEFKRVEQLSKIPQPSLAEFIDRYEKVINFSSSSSDDSQMAELISEKSKHSINEGIKATLSQPDSSKVTTITNQSAKGNVVQNQKIENKKSQDSHQVDADVGEVGEIKSPTSPPRKIKSPSPSSHEVVSSLKLSPEKVDLANYCYEYAVLSDTGTLDRVLLRPSPHFNIFSFSAVTASTELSNEPVRSAISSSVSRADPHERSRRRRRSDSDSDVEDVSNEWRRKRMKRSYECKSPRRRGRGKPLGRSFMNKRGAYQTEFRYNRGRREPSHRRERSSYRYSEKSDGDERRRSKSSDSRSRRSSPYSRDRSRSRPGSDYDDHRSVEGSRSTVRKERPRTPSSEFRRSARVPRESRKGTQPEVKIDRGLQDVQSRKLSSHFESLPTHRPEKREPVPPVKDKIKVERPQPQEFEEGEISDTSRSTILSISKKTSHFSGSSAARLSSPVADENRQALLQRVDLDQFLSYVHGEEKS